MSEEHIDKDSLMEQLDQNRANAIKFFWRVGPNNLSLRSEVTNKVSLLELAINELKNGDKEPAEVATYFKELVTDELRALNSVFERAEVANKKGLKKQPPKILTKRKMRVA